MQWLVDYNFRFESTEDDPQNKPQPFKYRHLAHIMAPNGPSVSD